MITGDDDVAETDATPTAIPNVTMGIVTMNPPEVPIVTPANVPVESLYDDHGNHANLRGERGALRGMHSVPAVTPTTLVMTPVDRPTSTTSGYHRWIK